MNLVARPATLFDAAALARWYAEDVLRLAERRPERMELDDHRRRIAAILADPGRHVLILHAESVRVGAALLERGRDGWVSTIFLKPAYLGRGYRDVAAAAIAVWLEAEGG